MFGISVLPYIFPLLAYVNTQENNSDNEYCSLCFKPRTHTMCLYPKKGPSDSCKGYSERILDDQEKELILHYQNYYRNKVALGYAENDQGNQPPAAGMLQLMWHNELQEIAQRWADQCIPFEDSAQHDTCKMTKEFEVGQNIITIGTLSSRLMNHSEAIKDWYQEMLDYDPDWVGSYKGSVKPPKKIGHYTQLLWAKTQYVGCASVTFVDVVRRKKFWVNRLVCNYGPSGNIIDASVYKVGHPCSKCPAGTSCSPHWGGLCATREQRSAPPVLPVEFTEPTDWVRRKYRRPALTDDVSIPAQLPISLSNRKRVLKKSTSLSTTKDLEYFTTTQSTTLSSTMSPIMASVIPSKTYQSSSVSSSMTSPTPPLNAPTTSNATTPTAPETGWSSSQSSPSSTTKQPTTPSPTAPETGWPSSQSSSSSSTKQPTTSSPTTPETGWPSSQSSSSSSTKQPTTSSPTTPETGWPSSQSSSSSTTKQPTTSSPKYTHKLQTSSTGKGTLFSFRRAQPKEVPQWSNEMDKENTRSYPYSLARRPGPQTARYSRQRTVFQRWRRRWKGAVCLCPVKGREDDEEFAKVDGVGKKGIRSHARTTVPSAAVAVSLLALKRLH